MSSSTSSSGALRAAARRHKPAAYKERQIEKGLCNVQ
jgi:hypothetical protein